MQILDVYLALNVELTRSSEVDVVNYLQTEYIRNALDIWFFQRTEKRYQLHVCRQNGAIRAHLGIYTTPEAVYVNLGGELVAGKELLSLVPSKAVLIMPNDFDCVVLSRIKYDVIYPKDIMLVKRREVNLKNSDLAIRLSAEKNSVEYSTFGSSFNAPAVPIEWIYESLKRDIVFGVFSNSQLASVAALVAWLPQVSVVMSVETKPQFRRRGLSCIAVLAAVQEGLKRSETCSLFVRSDNIPAINLYRSLGFKKIGEELWVDIGTGLTP